MHVSSRSTTVHAWSVGQHTNPEPHLLLYVVICSLVDNMQPLRGRWFTIGAGSLFVGIRNLFQQCIVMDKLSGSVVVGCEVFSIMLLPSSHTCHV